MINQESCRLDSSAPENKSDIFQGVTIDFKNRNICWRCTWLSGVAQKPIVLRLLPRSRMPLSSLNNYGEWKRDNGIIWVIKKRKKKKRESRINILGPHSKSVHSVHFDSNRHNTEISCLETPLFRYTDGYGNIFLTFWFLKKQDILTW